MSIIGDLLGANSAAKGQKKAAQAAEAASAASLAEQRRQFDQSRADMAPWLQTGGAALGQYAGLYGLGNNAGTGFVGTQQQGAAAPLGAVDPNSTFWQSPDYQFRQGEQARALTARNSQLGIQDSGAAQKAALQYSGNLASGEYNNYANRLAALAGVGQTAAQNNSQLGQNYANSVTGINQNKANALGSSYINQGNIWGNMFSDWGGQASQAASMFLGGR